MFERQLAIIPLAMQRVPRTTSTQATDLNQEPSTRKCRMKLVSAEGKNRSFIDTWWLQDEFLVWKQSMFG